MKDALTIFLIALLVVGCLGTGIIMKKWRYAACVQAGGGHFYCMTVGS